MLNRNDDQLEAKKLMLLCVAAASLVVLLFLAVLYFHDSKNKPKPVAKEKKQEEASEPDIVVGRSNVVSEDLDFWDMYSTGEKKPIADLDDDVVSKKSKKNQEITERIIKNSEKKKDDDEDSSDSDVKAEKDAMDDGKHVKVVSSDGKAAWYDILSDVNKNTFNFSEYLTYDNGFLKYNSSDVKSYIGADVSSYQGTIDFEKVKKAGIDFIMIKGASRGYETGQITIDEKFVEYAQGATAAGIPMGVIISSQAINDVEAIEEANFIVAASNNINAKYPVAIELTEVKNDKARTDKLTPKERTEIVKKFCETVKSFGKTPIVCASRDFFITELNLSDLTDYDLWLKDEAVTADYMRVTHIEDEATPTDERDKNVVTSSDDRNKTSDKDEKTTDNNEELKEERPDYIGTDFPYDFKMWQYTEKGTVNGINNSVNLNLSFVNYAEK